MFTSGRLLAFKNTDVIAPERPLSLQPANTPASLHPHQSAPAKMLPALSFVSATAGIGLLFPERAAIDPKQKLSIARFD